MKPSKCKHCGKLVRETVGKCGYCKKCIALARGGDAYKGEGTAKNR